MKFLILFSILFFIYVECNIYSKFSSEKSIRGQIDNIVCGANLTLSSQCRNTMSNGTLTNNFYNCAAYLCGVYNCLDFEWEYNEKRICNTLWGILCCGSNFYSNYCTEGDKEAFLKSISDLTGDITVDICPDITQSSFNCSGVNCSVCRKYKFES
jgi:hypothetical protein